MSCLLKSQTSQGTENEQKLLKEYENILKKINPLKKVLKVAKLHYQFVNDEQKA